MPVSVTETTSSRPARARDETASLRRRTPRLAPRNPNCHEQASQSPKMELDTSFAMLAPELSRLQVTTVNDSDEDMELED